MRLAVKRIDLHIHTVATKFDRKSFEFDIAALKNYVEVAKLSAIATTNHNVFDIDNYRLVCDAVDIPVFPGVELNVTMPGKYGHVLVIAGADDVDMFSICASTISSMFEAGRDHIGWDEVRALFSDIGKYLVMPHYRKDKQLDDLTLDAIRKSTGIDALEVSNAKKWLREIESAPEPLVLFSDGRPGERMPECEEDEALSRYAYGFTYVQCEEMTTASIKQALREKRNVGVFDKDNDFEILPEGVPVSRRINVIVGKRSSGKTFTLKRIMDSLQSSEYTYLRQFQITKNAEEDVFKENGSSEDERFCTCYFAPMQNALSGYLDDNDACRADVGDFCEALVRFAQSPESDCSKYPIFIAQSFVTDGIDNRIREDCKLIKAARTIRSSKERRELVSSLLGEDALRAFEHAVEDAAWQEYIKLRHIQLADQLRVKIQRGLAQFSSRKPLPETAPLREYLKSSCREQELSRLVGYLEQREELEAEVEGRFKLKRTRFGVVSATEARKNAKGMPKGADLAKLYGKKVTSLDQIRQLRTFPAEIRPFACRLLFKVESAIVNNDEQETPLSGGQRAEYVFVHEIKKAEGSEYVFLDEPESSFDNEFLIGEIADMVNSLAKRSTVFLVTHNNTLGVSLHPDRVIYAIKEAGKYRLYSGAMTSRELAASDGLTTGKAEVLLRTMEAGVDAYEDRKDYYETA